MSGTLSTRRGSHPPRKRRNSCQTPFMGFNPHRQYKRRPSDYVLVAVAIALVLALVVWGFFG